MRWTREEMQVAIQMRRSGRLLKEIADVIGRTPGAVRSRLGKMGVRRGMSPVQRFVAASEKPPAQLTEEVRIIFGLHMQRESVRSMRLRQRRRLADV